MACITMAINIALLIMSQNVHLSLFILVWLQVSKQC